MGGMEAAVYSRAELRLPRITRMDTDNTDNFQITFPSS
jgi:hypothetical protein